MKRKILSVILSELIIMTSTPFNLIATAEETYTPFKGSGTLADPYQIASAYDLRLLSELVNNEDTAVQFRTSCYIQTADIDLNNDPWVSIGTLWSDGKYNDFCFLGQYDGNYHTITNLNCVDDDNHCGLFGRLGVSGIDYTNKCIVSNLSVYGTVSSGGYCAGGIAGEISSGATIKNCSFTGNVSGEKSVGGIAGMTYDGGYVYNSYHIGNVKGISGTTGGIIGCLKTGQTENSVSGGIYNSYHAGGMVSCEKESQGGVAGAILFGEAKTDAQLFLENNFYESSSCDGGVNNEDIAGCTSLDSVNLKACADMLGSPFVDNDKSDNFNDGYPIFEWQTHPYQFKGSGTAEDPYQIFNKKELKKMRDMINSNYFGNQYKSCYYIQKSDIDLENELWSPIGLNNGFWGSYNGNYYKISNMKVDINRDYSGLFSQFRGNGVIENLSVYGSVSSSATRAGGICGAIINEGSTIQNCSFIGDINCTGYGVGGIVGHIWQSGTIKNCYHIGTIHGQVAGGIVGQITIGNERDGNVYIKNNYHVGTITGDNGNIGGIVGKSWKGSDYNGTSNIINCYYIKNDSTVGANGYFDSYDVIGVSETLLKKYAEDLGEPFIANEDDTINDGFPIFEWQVKKALDVKLSGDTNCDNNVDIADVVILKCYLINSKDYSITEQGIVNADVNNRGNGLNTQDSLAILKYLLKLIDSL